MEETAQRMSVEERKDRVETPKYSGEQCHGDPNARAQEDSDKVGPRDQLSRRRKTEKEKEKLVRISSSGVEKGRTSRFDFVASKPSCHHKFTSPLRYSDDVR